MKLLAHLLVVAALIGVVIGFAVIMEHPALGMALIAGGPLVVAALFMLVRDLDSHAHQRHEQEIESAIQKELPELQRADYVMTVQGSSGFVRSLFAIALVGGFWYATLAIVDQLQSTGHFIILGLFTIALVQLTVFVAGYLLAALTIVGKPVVALTREGIQSPLYGTIAWQAIDGIALQTFTARGNVVGHALELRVPQLADMVDKFEFAAQLIQLFRYDDKSTRISIELRRINVAPEVIVHIARELFSRATGRSAIWHPGLSKEFNDAVQDINARPAQRFSLLQSENPKKLLAETERFLRNSAALDSEYKRIKRKVLWFLVLLITGIVLIGAPGIIKRLL